MSDSLFSQKSPGQVPTGQDQQAVDANPSEQSGGNVRVTAPVWQKFVTNTVAQAMNQDTVRAENDTIRQARYDNRQAERAAKEKWGGDNGRLFRKTAAGMEQFNAEDYGDHPELAPIARKSVWDRDKRRAAAEHRDYAMRLQDPAFKAKSLRDKEREDMLAEGGVLPETDPRHVELKARLAADDDYRAEKADLERKSYEAKRRAFEIEQTDPDTHWSSRQQPTVEAKRAEQVATAQAARAEAEQVDASAADEEKSIRAELAQGVRGPDVAAKQARLDQITQARQLASEKKVGADMGIEQVKAEARGFIDNTITAAKRGYAGAAQSSNILQGATAMSAAREPTG